jgi:2',3'-cyclic-nucleotide 2'-phosphodiesterase (5'-nucleotidase family)
MMRRSLLLSALCLVAVACGGKEEEVVVEGTVIGSTSVEIDSRMVTTRVKESALGNYMSDVLLAEMKAKGKSVDIAFVNAGAIRGGAVVDFAFTSDEARLGKLYPAGSLTDLDVAGWFPFQNDHDLRTVTGTQLKSILERGASSLPADLRADQGGWFLQVAGLKYTIDCAGTVQQLNTAGDAVETEGSRISRIQVGETVVFDAANSVDTLASTSFNVVLNSFLATGADGHLALKQSTLVETFPFAGFNYVERLQAHVKDHSPIAPAVDGRITIVGECGKPSTTP